MFLEGFLCIQQFFENSILSFKSELMQYRLTPDVVTYNGLWGTKDSRRGTVEYYLKGRAERQMEL